MKFIKLIRHPDNKDIFVNIESIISITPSNAAGARLFLNANKDNRIVVEESIPKIFEKINEADRYGLCAINTYSHNIGEHIEHIAKDTETLPSKSSMLFVTASAPLTIHNIEAGRDEQQLTIIKESYDFPLMFTQNGNICLGQKDVTFFAGTRIQFGYKESTKKWHLMSFTKGE